MKSEITLKSHTSLWKLLAALAASAFLLANAAAAQEGARIGFVSQDRIMRDAAPAKAATAKLEQEFAKRDRDLQDLGNRIKALSDKLDKDGPVLSDSDRGRRQRELADLDKEFQRKRREFQEDLNQRRNEELSAIIERANRAIKQIAEADKLDVVLQDAVYVNPRIDITEKVLKALNNGK